MAKRKGLSQRELNRMHRKYDVDFRTAEKISMQGFEFYFQRFIEEIIPFLRKIQVKKDSLNYDASPNDLEELKRLLDRILGQTLELYDARKYEQEFDRIFRNIQLKKKGDWQTQLLAKLSVKPDDQILDRIQSTLRVRIQGQIESVAEQFAAVSRVENKTLSDNLVIKQQQEINNVTNRVLEGVKSGERWETISKAILGAENPKSSYDVIRAAARDGDADAQKMLNRARFIARNAVSTAQGEYDRQVNQQIGIELYQWSTSDDDRVRPTHDDLDNKIFAWEPGTKAPYDIVLNGKKYSKGDIIPTASDPKYNGGSPTIPGQPWNCRCVAIPVIEGIDY